MGISPYCMEIHNGRSLDFTMITRVALARVQGLIGVLSKAKCELHDKLAYFGVKWGVELPLGLGCSDHRQSDVGWCSLFLAVILIEIELFWLVWLVWLIGGGFVSLVS